MSDSLMSLLVEIGCDPSALNAGLRQAVAQGKAAGDAAGSAFALGFRAPLLNALGGIGPALQGAKDVLQLAGAGSGVNIAARYQVLEAGLKGILKSGTEAHRVLTELDDLGGNTAFNTTELIDFSRSLLAVGVSAKNIKGDLSSMADAVSTIGGSTADLGRLSENMRQIRTSAHPEQMDLKQISRLGINLDSIVSSALGKELKAMVCGGCLKSVRYSCPQPVQRGADSIAGLWHTGQAFNASGTVTVSLNGILHPFLIGLRDYSETIRQNPTPKKCAQEIQRNPTPKKRAHSGGRD